MLGRPQIRGFGDPALGSTCKEIADVNGKVLQLASQLLGIMNRDPYSIGVAANQIGRMQRMFVVDSEYVESPLDILINPRITGSSGMIEMVEGCMSLPDYFTHVSRPETVEVSAISSEGEEVVFESSGLGARLIQHELDHLDGLLLFDRLEDDEKRRSIRDYVTGDFERTAKHSRRRRRML